MTSSKASVWNESRTMRTTFFPFEKENFPVSSTENLLKLGVSGLAKEQGGAVPQLDDEEHEAGRAGERQEPPGENERGDEDNGPDEPVDEAVTAHRTPRDGPPVQGPVIPEQEISLKPEKEAEGEDEGQRLLEPDRAQGFESEEHGGKDERGQDDGRGPGEGQVGERIGEFDRVGQENGARQEEE